ncbi:DUF2631 domain-containing protein [Corynebacterium parakroppenstedtii]|uniref:DUF2631 domain-containing protein n=1 Tax=Corynebacterium parakroppenstedtii TaxID=2828363 RepID=UPI001C8F4D28|nr:DUF2631 domain-containing protein [Corynebacterium parakroppenstedtii]MBY0794687.1 DUF2631 domain-containing protein [Corynebacterium parakroppenstedtii]
MSETKDKVYDGVSTKDEPSAFWGWHDLGRRQVIIAGIVGGLFLLFMLVGNHKGHVEDIFLIATAALCFVGALLIALRPKLNQVRTVTAHNKAADYVERDWAADQLNLHGVYSDLSDSQLRSLNIDPATLKGQRAVQGN